MVVVVSHKEREIDSSIFALKRKQNRLIERIQEEAFRFIEQRFGMRYLGRHILKGRTFAVVEAGSVEDVERMVRIGTPVFAKLTGCPFEDIRVETVGHEVERAIEICKEAA